MFKCFKYLVYRVEKPPSPKLFNNGEIVSGSSYWTEAELDGFLTGNRPYKQTTCLPRKKRINKMVMLKCHNII